MRTKWGNREVGAWIETIGLGILYLALWDQLSTPIGVGTQLQRLLLGGVGLCALAGGALGAQWRDEIERWRPLGPRTPGFPGDFLAVRLWQTGRPVFGLLGLGFAATLLAGAISGAAWGGLLSSWWILGGVWVAGVGLGAWVQRGLGSVPLTTAAVAGIFSVPWSLFIWGPTVLSTRSEALGWFLRLNPAGGIVAAWKLRAVFWSPIFYGWLPYAEYPVSLWGPGWHGLLWGMIGLGLLGVQGWRLVRGWSAP